MIDPQEPLQLSYDDYPNEGFVDGVRLSTECLSRRMIEPIDPERYRQFPEHLSVRGHSFERVVQEWMRVVHGIEALREVVVPFEWGETHLDLFMPAGGAPVWDTRGRPMQVELKVNADAQVRTENVRQVQRQRFAVELALVEGRTIRCREKIDGEWRWRTIDPELYADTDWRLVVVDPLTWRIPQRDGVRVTISDERRAELEHEWSVMRDVMGRSASTLKYDVEFPAERIAPCTCSHCDPEQVLDELPADLVGDAHAYLHAMGEERDAKEAKQHHGDQLKAALVVLRRQASYLLDGKGSWVGGGVRVTLTKSGSLRVTESDAKPTERLV